jgi:FkbM family methyltransferase
MTKLHVRRVLKSLFPIFATAYKLHRNSRAADIPCDTPYGFKLACPPVAAAGKWFVEQVMSGDYEREETMLVDALLGNTDVFVDVGANVGWYTCLAAKRGVYVVAFEPNSVNQLFLKRSLEHNGGAGIELFPMALSSSPSLVRMYGSMGTASLIPGWAGAIDEQELVPATTLDIGLGRRFAGKRVLVKIDVEGFELEVLAGASEVLAMQPKPMWVVEVLLKQDKGPLNLRFREVFELFFDHGYRAETADSQRRTVTLTDIERWLQQGTVGFGGTNYLFSPRQ